MCLSKRLYLRIQVSFFATHQFYVLSLMVYVQYWFLISLGFSRFLTTSFSDFRWLHWSVLLHMKQCRLFFNLLLCIDFLFWCFSCNKVILVSKRISLKYFPICSNTTFGYLHIFPGCLKYLIIYFYIQILWVFKQISPFKTRYECISCLCFT